jgi:hypothetical protein
VSKTYYSLEHNCDICEVCENFVEPDDVTGELTCIECLLRAEKAIKDTP